MKKINFDDERKLLRETGLTDEELTVYYNKTISKEPYVFSYNYAELNSQARYVLNVTHKNYLQVIHREAWGSIVSKQMDKDINDSLRLVKLKDSLVPLITHTKNKFFYRHLFFPCIFINNDFEFEDLTIKGILVIDHDSYFRHMNIHLQEGLVGRDWTIFAVAVDKKRRSEFYTNIRLVDKTIGEEFFEFGYEKDVVHRMIDFLRTVSVNVVDMIESKHHKEELELVTVERTREQNLKRLKRGKIQIPTTVYIRPRGKFIHYVDDFNTNICNKVSYMFMVMGFWRHYESERYVNVKGKQQWIYPFWKGKGKKFTKDYKVIDGRLDEDEV